MANRVTITNSARLTIYVKTMNVLEVEPLVLSTKRATRRLTAVYRSLYHAFLMLSAARINFAYLLMGRVRDPVNVLISRIFVRLYMTRYADVME